jgi:hypothetical protein
MPHRGKEVKSLGVSEVVGTIILVGVVMIGIVLVGILLLSNPAPSKVPTFDSIISNRSKTVYIYHKGGDPLYRGQYSILIDGGDQTANFTIMSPGTEPWSVGETLSNTTPNMPKHVVIVFNQGGGGGTIIGDGNFIGSVTLAMNPNAWYFNPIAGTCNWKYRKQITIDHTQVTADQSYFSVLISLTSDPDLLGHARPDGFDILFTQSDGMTQIPHEIENYTSGTGALTAWVNVPALSSTSDTVLYMYYGNLSSTTPQQTPTAVWASNNYVGVWHLKEDPSGGAPQMQDSTSGANHGTSQGSMTSADLVAAQVDGGLDFDGSNDYLSTNYVQTGVTAYTIEAWLRTATTSKLLALVQDRGSGAGKSLTLSIGGTYSGAPGSGLAGDVAYGVDSNSMYIGVNSTSTVNDNLWHHVAGTWTAPSGTAIAPAQFSLYIDGNPAATNTIQVSSTTSPLTGLSGTLIARHQAWSTYFPGQLDEVRISNSVRPEAWIKTEYNNQKSPSTFSTLGNEERWWKC